MQFISVPKIVKDTQYIGIPYWIPGLIIFIIFLILGVALEPVLLTTVLTWVLILSPLWAPVTLIVIFWTWWVKYVRAGFIAKQKPVLLEIKIPRQLFKTPKAMEAVFAALQLGPGETTFIGRWWNGKVRPWWSFEITSIEGKLHFYVWMWEPYRAFIESQLYAQYPNIELHEVEDYSSGLFSDPEKNAVFGMEFALDKPDAYPIKTYIDYELDQDAKKAEQVVDPLSGVLERIATMQPGEQMWIQVIIRIRIIQIGN